MENNEFLRNSASIEDEPKQNFHFRYESDIEKGSHGILNGQLGEYPKIKLRLPEDGHKEECGKDRDFFVLCSLHCFDNNKPLSPHLLMLKGEKKLNYKFIFEEMEKCEGNSTERIWELKDYIIVRSTKKEYKKSLEEKQKEFDELKLPLKFAGILGQLNLNDQLSVENSAKLNVCLGFTIFERNCVDKTFSLYRDTIYSCIIYNGDDLKIKKLCNTKGSVLGGKDITILIKFESNLPLNVLIKKINKNTKETEWSKEVEILKANIFQNASIWFDLPRYDGPSTNDDEEIEVLMCVKVRNTTYKSNNVKFYYINEKSPKRTRDSDTYGDSSSQNESKRSKGNKTIVSRDSSDLTTASPPPPPGESARNRNDVIKDHIDLIFRESEQHMLYEYMETVFYDALETRDTLIHLYKKANEFKMQHLIADFRNDNRENLLHIACKRNYFKSIRPLIGLGCHVNQQDCYGATPLHVALADRNNDCISEFQKLFNDYSQYSENVKVDLIKMLQTYNHNGHTVVHEAVLNDYDELLEIMLAFMQKHELNILDYEVLGSGDTIVHLAVKSNTLTSIKSIILKYIPNYMTVTNYAGVMPNDLIDDFAQNLTI